MVNADWSPVRFESGPVSPRSGPAPVLSCCGPVRFNSGPVSIRPRSCPVSSDCGLGGLGRWKRKSPAR